MQMQKEELQVLLLLVLSILAIGLLYVASSPSTILPEAKAGLAGEVSIEGTLLHKETTYNGGHILMTVKTPEGPVTVFVPASSDSYETASGAEPGCVLSITGKEQEYKGEMEIVPSAMMIK